MKQDKLYHLIAGAVIALFFAFYFNNPAITFFATVAAGIGKEVYDWAYNKYIMPKHTVEVMDAVYTIAGGAIVSIVHFFLY
jgi:uncharacterized membrane protein YjjP (DUF1212 family)